jgi:hypothetical protein
MRYPWDRKLFVGPVRWNEMLRRRDRFGPSEACER